VTTQTQNTSTKEMPDVAATSSSSIGGTLNRVGMSEVEIPVKIEDHNGATMVVPAKADLYVSLDKSEAKGIHMSRLFLITEEVLEEQNLNFETVGTLLEKFLSSHDGLSSRASVAFKFEYMTQRPALLSQNKGWRFYPMSIGGFRKQGQNFYDLHLRITYSSTCPCSAALARQIIQEKFSKKFDQEAVSKEDVMDWLGSEEGVSATPHSQRSFAEIILRSTNPNFAEKPTEIIDLIENALSTPVQAAVKREDEQEFARLNGENPMFCEDAARKLKTAVEAIANVEDYRIEARHFESLHPHDAVAIVTKGLDNGLQP
jgi:GTP cyclohydrolase I